MEKLKQKVATSSSRVIASLQQAATGNFQQQQQANESSSSSQRRQVEPPPGSKQQQVVGARPASSSAARLMAADATAHLTEGEREILLKVFKKEEQFQRDTIKQMNASRALQMQPSLLDDEAAKRNNQQQQQLSSGDDQTGGLRRQQRTTPNQPRCAQPFNQRTGTGNLQQQASGGSFSSNQSQMSSASQSSRSNSRAGGASYSSFGLARSATPLSRPGSSLFGSATPTQSTTTGGGGPRTASSCSSAATLSGTGDGSGGAGQPVGQCRICRKLILANETCHLCSTCDQFICEDCGSYSATEQHWMCSSCRRRATKPAIPDDALKELGLNQNSSAVRRMTLRLNQAELKMALGKCSSESTTSSNSSSGCSSSSAAAAAASVPVPAAVAAGKAPTSAASNPSSQTATSQTSARARRQSQQQQQQQKSRATAASGASSAGHGGGANLMMPSQQQQQQHQQPGSGAAPRPGAQTTAGQVEQPTERQIKHCDVANNISNSPSHQQQQQQQRRGSWAAKAARSHAQKTLSQPSSAAAGRAPQQQHESAAATVAASGDDRDQAALSNQSMRQVTSPAMQRQQQQQVQRRASMATSSLTSSGGSGGVGGRERKLSVAGQQAAASSAAGIKFGCDRRFAALGQRHQFVVQQPLQHQQPRTMVTAATSNESQMNGSLRDLMIAQQRRSSQLSSHNTSNQQLLQQQQHYGSGQMHGDMASACTTLIPIPPDQIHLRRLSDQSNLVRRSSIIADTIDCTSMARNRSHSNIDTVSYSAYMMQAPDMMMPRYSIDNNDDAVPGGHTSVAQHLMYTNYQTDESYGGQLGVATNSQQARRPSDQWVLQQRMAANQQQQQQQQITSIITPYSQKQQQPNSSEEGFHSDSSSDIDDDPIINQAPRGQSAIGLEPSEYFATPRALTASDMNIYQLQQHQQQQQNGPMSIIPSVNVSEFAPGQRRDSVQQFSSQQQQVASAYDNQMIMTTPMQINVAIEQAIQRQQQHPHMQHNAGAQNHELDPYQAGYLIPRRGSSGRVLPKIPGHGEQSRSLLDLQHGAGGGSGGQMMMNGLGSGATGITNGLHSSTLDLPASTVRRASAPEGQNIKIVVDDIDAFGVLGSNSSGLGGGCGKDHRGSGARGPTKGAAGAGISGGYALGGHLSKGGELLERLVLYRDDSIDPTTNLARGFGLQVMGGKISEPASHGPVAAGGNHLLHACVSWVLPGGPADKVGLKRGDQIIEWDGKCLVNMTYEQVTDVIESSANIAELLVKPARKLEVQPGAANYVRSQRRLSQQTERDLRRLHSASGATHQQQQQQQQQQQLTREYWPQVQPSIGNLHCRSTGQLHLQQGQTQQQAASASSSPQRAGRRLPKIPGLSLPPDTSSSTSQLVEHQQAYQQHSHLLASTLQDQQHQQQAQSRSTGDIYPTSGQQEPMYQQQAAIVCGMNPSQGSEHNQYSGGQNGFSHHHQQQHRPPYQAPADGGRYFLSAVQNEVCGLIGLQVSVDERMAQLEISVLSALNIDRNPSLDYCVRLKILPESKRYKACTTQPSCDMNWKETFLFQNFCTQQINRMALEIGIWVYDDAPSRLSTQVAQPICEALIPLQSALERNTDFWPLRPPPTSPQARRRSLNDLIETHRINESRFVANDDCTYAGCNNSALRLQQQQPQVWPAASHHQQHVANMNDSQAATMTTAKQLVRMDSTTIDYSAAARRERSASNRNLPSDQLAVAANKLRVQPRRASDEVAGSSSHRLSARLSPAASRRSISVMNVGDGAAASASSLLVRPSSKMGSQSGVQRRDSAGQQQQVTADAQAVGVTPAGRRSSLVGIQSMSGYRSQKNSQSGSTTDNPESPLRSGQQQKRPQSASAHHHRASVAATPGHAYAGGSPPVGGSGSRRGSSEQQQQQHGGHHGHHGQFQRKGSFAMQTLRKLKRTMSLTKGGPAAGDSVGNLVDGSAATSTQGSRRSSSSSNQSAVSDLGEDVGLARRLMSAAHGTSFVGKLKLSFIMTKGQLEIEVISAQGLRLDAGHESSSSSSIYVKMYLIGSKNRSNKRKTRSVQWSDAPVFKQVIKYDGSLVDNKTLEVSVWQKLGGLKGKSPIGFTEIRLNELNLEQLQTSFYNLRPMDIVCNSSLEEA